MKKEEPKKNPKPGHMKFDHKKKAKMTSFKDLNSEENRSSFSQLDEIDSKLSQMKEQSK